jgi:hypothetical protein
MNNELRDKMVSCMDFIRTYCKEINQCIDCPMYENCHSSDDNKRFPYFWNIPDIPMEM